MTSARALGSSSSGCHSLERVDSFIKWGADAAFQNRKQGKKEKVAASAPKRTYLAISLTNPTSKCSEIFFFTEPGTVAGALASFVWDWPRGL
jgi:hypothetical protein